MRFNTGTIGDVPGAVDSRGGAMGAVHAACRFDNFPAMECHAVDFMSWRPNLVTGVPVVKEHLRYPGYFEPATDWDKATSMPPGAVGWPRFNRFGQWVTGNSDR